MKTYRVNRQHYGDKDYEEGDERVANPTDVAHLVANGVLTLVEGPVAAPMVIPGKAEPVLPNKAERLLRNKAG